MVTIGGGVGTQAFIKLTFKLFLIVAWLDRSSVIYMLAYFGQGQMGHVLYASSKRTAIIFSWSTLIYLYIIACMVGLATVLLTVYTKQNCAWSSLL